LLEAVFNCLSGAVSNRMLEAVSSRFLKPSVFQKKIDSEKKLFKT